MSRLNDVQRQVCYRAVLAFGYRSQLIKLAEELAELSKEVLKAANFEQNWERLAEERADVSVMLCQLDHLMSRHQELVNRYIEEKVMRLADLCDLQERRPVWREVV